MPLTTAPTVNVSRSPVTRRRGGGAPASVPPPPVEVVLSAINLAANTVVEGSVAGTVVGAILNKTAGSTLSLTDTAGGRFAISGSNLVTGSTAADYETATSHSVTFRETLAGAVGSPRDTVLMVAVTDVAEDALWTPAALGTDLVAWYDASDAATVTQAAGAVSQISDKSGNGRHMVQATGSLQGAYTTAAQNGLNALTIVDDWMEANVAAGTFAGGLCFASAWRVTGSSAAGFSAAPLNRALSAISAPFQGFNGGRVLGTGAGETPSGVGFENLGNSPLLMSWNTLVQSVTLGSPGTYNEWINGAPQNSFNANCSDTATTLSMATRSADRATTTKAIIGEIVATKPIGNSDRQKLEGYLAHKWGLAANLPADHPYKIAPPAGGAGTFMVDEAGNRIINESGDGMTWTS
jgi:hypothetical protein